MSFDVLSRHLNVFESHFLEASAGTGKTFAIEHLVTRLLIEEKTPLTIEQILVVTFTRAAARELKQRILRSLRKTAEELRKERSSIDYLQAILEKGEDARRSAIEKIEAALICYDAAQIYTLHGFCHRLLKAFAFEAHVAMQVSDPDEREYVPALELLVKEHLKQHVTAPHYSPTQVRSLLGRYRKDPRKMIASLVELISQGRKIAQVPSHKELIEKFQAELDELPDIDISFLKQDLTLLITHYKQMPEETLSQIDLLSSVVSSKKCTLKQFDLLLNSPFFLEKMQEGNRKVRSKFPEASALHYPGLVEKMRDCLLPLIAIAKDSSKTFLRIANDLQEKAEDLLEKQETFSPDRLLLKVQQAVKRQGFTERVRQKFRAAIIDEFQDTDPVQWEIFKQLFLSKMDAVCLVGDPKQSIYGFRNADLYVYLEAASTMGASAKKYLDTNFRSTPPLVEALNLLFSQAKEGWMDLPGSSQPLQVLPVRAGSAAHFEDTEAPILFFVASGKKGRERKFPTEQMLEEKVFPYLASEIVKLHTEKRVALHEIAILIKDRFQAQAVIAFLKKCGIPAATRRGGSIVETPAYFALKELLLAVLSPSDLSKVKVALGGPIFGWPAEKLKGSGEDPDLLEAKAQMQWLKSALIEKGFGLFFQRFLSLFSQYPPFYLQLRKLAELLIEEELTSGLKAEGLLRFLEEMATKAHAEQDRFRVPQEEEQGSVTVMTMHMSKGLEFDVVFALGVASRHKPTLEHIVVKTTEGSELKPFNPLDPACQLALEEVNAEKLRQLYVALTRAKRRLYIPLMISEEEKEFDRAEASPIELFFAKTGMQNPIQMVESLAPLIDLQILQEAPPPTFTISSESFTEEVPSCQLHLPCYEERIFSFSALAHKETTADKIELFSDASLSPHTMPLGAETGQLLHLLFEKIFKRGLHHPLDASKIQALVDEEVVFSPLEDWKSVLAPWILELLTLPLTTFSLANIPRDQLQQEMEFLFQTKKGMMKGFADLFFLYEGKYYLLDWKSNCLGPTDADYTQEKMAQAMKQHDYFLQASIYRDALERYVKLFDNRPFSECFGGAIYYFVRGKAVYHFFPEPGSW